MLRVLCPVISIATASGTPALERLCAAPALVVNIRKAASSKPAEGRFMKTKFTTLVLGSLVAGSLVLSTDPALARDWERRNNASSGFHSRDSHNPDSRHPAPGYSAGRYRTWGWGSPAARFPVPVYRPVPVPSYGYPAYGYPVAGPAYSQDLYRQLDNARRKLAYDLDHHASREQLASDAAHINRLKRQLGLR